MNCKNCSRILNDSDKFCLDCGAKVVNYRLSTKKLLSDLSKNVFAWDNKFLLTLKTLILRPQVLFEEYLGGTRKKFARPLAFLAVCAAIGAIVFNVFSDEYSAMITDQSLTFNEQLSGNVEGVPEVTDKMDKNPIDFMNGKSQKDVNSEINQFIIKHFYMFSFLLLPLYSLMSFLVYRKPYNYGEHLVMNSYCQGLTILVSIFLLLISLVTSPMVFMSSYVLTIGFYLYAFTKLYKHSFKQMLGKLLKFIGVGLLIFVILMIVGALIGIVYALIIK